MLRRASVRGMIHVYQGLCKLYVVTLSIISWNELELAVVSNYF